MTSAEKITALDNLENLYTSAVNYIDAITHSSSYYTDAECSKFFSSANDGHTSGLIAATLDGMTAEQVIAAGSPSGVIAFWSGSEASIPSGWLLCNGLNGTPDLRDRFVPGPGSHYSKGDTGGSDTVTTTGTVTIAGHTLTASEIAKHTHGTIVDYYPLLTNAEVVESSGSSNHGMVNATTTTPANTGYTGDGGSHTHSASWGGTDNQEKRPPFYALCFIQKS